VLLRCRIPSRRSRGRTEGALARLHGHEVDDAAEIGAFAPGQGKGHGAGHEGGELGEGIIEGRATPVHLVDEADEGEAPLRAVLQYCLGPRLDARDGAEGDDGAVEDPETPLDLGAEIDVAGRVD
jgi:hypothetical protein